MVGGSPWQRPWSEAAPGGDHGWRWPWVATWMLVEPGDKHGWRRPRAATGILAAPGGDHGWRRPWAMTGMLAAPGDDHGRRWPRAVSIVVGGGRAATIVGAGDWATTRMLTELEGNHSWRGPWEQPGHWRLGRNREQPGWRQIVIKYW